MRFSIALLSVVLISSPVYAGTSICNDRLSNDSALYGPVNEGDFDFNYESRADKKRTGGFLVDYCIQNNSQNGVLYIHWHDGKNTTYFKKPIPGGAKKARGGKTYFVDAVPSDNKELSYDWTEDYSNTEDVETFHVAASRRDAIIHLVQFSPTLPEEFGAPVANIASDAKLMNQYLDFLSERVPELDSLRLSAWSLDWIPTSIETSKKLAEGERVGNEDATFYEIAYSVVSEINIKDRSISVTLQASIPDPYVKIAANSETLNSITIEARELDGLKVSGAEIVNANFKPIASNLAMGTLNSDGKLEVQSAAARLSINGDEISETAFDFWSQ